MKNIPYTIKSSAPFANGLQRYIKIPSLKKEWEDIFFIYAFLWLGNQNYNPRKGTEVSTSWVWSAKMVLQTKEFFLCKSIHEIFRETLDISFYLPIHLFHFYLINWCKISVYKHLFASDRNDKFLNIMLTKSWLVFLKVVAICDYLFWLITIDDKSLYFFESMEWRS